MDLLLQEKELLVKILLIEEEIPYNPKNSVLEKFVYETFQAGAKAQLKKVGRLLLKRCTIQDLTAFRLRDERQWYRITLELPDEEWQALLKEVEDG